MVMMSPDGRYVVTGGTRANKAYIIDSHTLELVKVIPVDIAPEHLSFSPDSRWYYQGNPDGDSISVIDMQSLTKIKTIPGFAEPLNVTFTPDGSKAYVGNYGAHWVGVVDVRRHELAKKIQVAAMPGVAKLDPSKYLGEIKGINIATPTPDGRYLYAADGDLGMVGVIDTREDRVIKSIQVGKDPWRVYMSHDGKYAITPNNGDETISIIDVKANKVAATLEAGPNMTGVNFAAGKAFVISSTSGFVYVYNMSSLRPAVVSSWVRTFSLRRRPQIPQIRNFIWRNPQPMKSSSSMPAQKPWSGWATSDCSPGEHTSWTARITTAIDVRVKTGKMGTYSDLATRHRSMSPFLFLLLFFIMVSARGAGYSRSHPHESARYPSHRDAGLGCHPHIEVPSLSALFNKLSASARRSTKRTRFSPARLRPLKAASFKWVSAFEASLQSQRHPCIRPASHGCDEGRECNRGSHVVWGRR
jgi:YVTN family beta-propeller protein